MVDDSDFVQAALAVASPENRKLLENISRLPALRVLGDAFVGLMSDRVASVRIRQALELAKRTQTHCENLGIDPSQAKPLALKYSAPFVEAATLEDDATMLDLWARLLAGAIGGAEMSALYIRVLRELNSQDAYVIRKLVQNRRYIDQLNTRDSDAAEHARAVQERPDPWIIAVGGPQAPMSRLESRKFANEIGFWGDFGVSGKVEEIARLEFAGLVFIGEFGRPEPTEFAVRFMAALGVEELPLDVAQERLEELHKAISKKLAKKTRDAPQQDP